MLNKLQDYALKGERSTEKEVPLFTDQERIECGSILDNYEKLTEDNESFIIPKHKKNGNKNKRIMINQTKAIKKKIPTKSGLVAQK
jgi:hypothetical protein